MKISKNTLNKYRHIHRIRIHVVFFIASNKGSVTGRGVDNTTEKSLICQYFPKKRLYRAAKCFTVVANIL